MRPRPNFQELLQFVREARFERMGAFAYSEEEGTYSAGHYTDDVPDAVKQQRLDTLMAEQEAISLEVNQSKVGQRRGSLSTVKRPTIMWGAASTIRPKSTPKFLLKKRNLCKSENFMR